MQRRMRTVWGSIIVAMLLSVGFVPAASAEPNICVSVNGVNYVDLGSADCESSAGNTSIAVGEDSFAETSEGSDGEPVGSGNTAVAIGGSSTYVHDESNNTTGVGIGEENFVDFDDTNNTTGVAVGDFNTVNFDISGSSTSNDNSTGVVIGDEIFTDIQFSDSTGINLHDDSELFIEEDGCFVVVLPDGTTVGDEEFTCFGIFN